MKEDELVDEDRRADGMLEYSGHLLSSLVESDDPVSLLKREACSNYFWADDDELREVAQEHEGFATIWDLCSVALERLCQRNLGECEFYASLTQFLLGDGLFSNNEERRLALFCALCNPRIPYKRFSSGEMSEEEFESRLDANQLELRYLRQIALRSFSQKTQQAHAAWEVLDQVPDKADRDVLLAMLLAFARA